ncbi:MAG: hypothetical protein H6634_04735 [Anaerolineales bacterium]|nr:hypothetical protein [Anaerolineales bacterium]MCB9110534.1 hypothetical protein [Anaerolineales bacterium]
MNAKKLSILFAVVVVIAAQLACAVGGEPSLSNMRSARDSDGNQPSTTFGAFDTVYVVGNLANGAAGNQVVSRWYAVNVPGYDPNYFIDEAQVNVENDNFNGTIYFYFEPPSDGWPSGTYKAEIYFNGTLNSTVNFSIQ